MNTILTDDERRQAIQSIVLTSPGTADQIARAVEAAVLAKLARQEPVAWQVRLRCKANKNQAWSSWSECDERAAKAYQASVDEQWEYETRTLYTHPAQQADRQRVPDGWKLVPVEPTIEMLEAMHTENLTFYASEQREAYAAMLAAAPEAPAQAEPGVFRNTLRLSLDHPNQPAQAEQAAEPVRDEREPSPTAGMTLGQRILHVGGRTNAAGYVEFGSVQAVDALVRHVLRDLPDSAALASTERQPLTDRLRKAREFIRADADLARGIGGKEQG